MADTKEKGRSLYYHRYTPQMMGSGAPAYGAPAYGASAYGASSYGASGAGDGEGEGGGALSVGRIIRVCATHWMTIFVFLILGLLAAFVLYQLLPQRFEAEAYYEMSVRGQSMVMGQVYVDEGGSTAPTLREVFNTRKAQFDTDRVRKAVIDLYRTEHSGSNVSTETLVETLKKYTEMDLVPMSRLVKVVVETGDPTLSADLANCYVSVCKTFMDEQNRAQAEAAVAFLAASLDNEEHVLRQLDGELLDLRKSRNIETLNRERETVQASLSALDSQVIELTTQIRQSKEIQAGLEIVRQDPSQFGSLPESFPRSGEIGTAYQRWQEASTERKTLLIKLTENHPDVKLKTREEEVYREQFAEAAQRAYSTGKATLEMLERQVDPLRQRAEEIRAKLVELDTQVIAAEMAIQQLERARETEVTKITDLRSRMRVAELKADENAATIRPIAPALPPEEQSSPNPYIIFTAGTLIGIAFGTLFVLLLDRMEDKLTDVTDIEKRLHQKALAVFPHLRRKQRAQVATTVRDDPFSQYAESMAGLRNLLDSPRYHDMTRAILCVSTQPAEGKTCTSTNIAISYAQSGQKTLLVDFDLRRPRMAGIFGRQPGSFPSLPHILARNDASLFETLPQETDVPSLHVILARASNSISPSMLMGTNIITDFFAWARANYDRVIIDSPPFGLVGDVIMLANLVDSVILVATPDKTRFGPINFAVRRLTDVGARILGVVVNNVDFGRWAGFSRYETRYGYFAYGYAPKAVGKENPDELKSAVFTVKPGDVADKADDTPDDKPLDGRMASSEED